MEIRGDIDNLVVKRSSAGAGLFYSDDSHHFFNALAVGRHLEFGEACFEFGALKKITLFVLKQHFHHLVHQRVKKSH